MCLSLIIFNDKVRITVQINNIQDFIDIYHARWGVEELYKISKCIYIVEDFHSKNERGVKQEIFAHFALITMNRIFANQADSDLNQSNNSRVKTNDKNYPSVTHQEPKIKINFKNCIQVFARSIEELMLLKNTMNKTVQRAYNFIIGQYQKVRPNRSYIRKSMKPESKWRSNEKKKKNNQKVSLESAT